MNNCNSISVTNTFVPSIK